jgi:transposase
MRRTHLRGHANILKRLFVHAGACDLGLLLRTLCGFGTPRSLQGRAHALLTAVIAIVSGNKTNSADSLMIMVRR